MARPAFDAVDIAQFGVAEIQGVAGLGAGKDVLACAAVDLFHRFRSAEPAERDAVVAIAAKDSIRAVAARYPVRPLVGALDDKGIVPSATG